MPIRIVLSSVVMLLLVACASTGEPDPALAGQVTPAQIVAGSRVPEVGQHLVWSGTIQAVRNLRDRTLIEILSYPASRQRQPLLDRPATGLYVLEMEGFLEPARLPVGTTLTAGGEYMGLTEFRHGDVLRRLPGLKGTRLDVWARPAATARQRPDVRFGVGVGSGGSGAGVSIGF